MADKQLAPLEIPNAREHGFFAAGLKHRGDGFCTFMNRRIFRWLLLLVKPSQTESHQFDGLTVSF
jgi:hypothetical protein